MASCAAKVEYSAGGRSFSLASPRAAWVFALLLLFGRVECLGFGLYRGVFRLNVPSGSVLSPRKLVSNQKSSSSVLLVLLTIQSSTLNRPRKCMFHTILPPSTRSTCSDTILSSAIASSIAISLSVNVTTLSPNAAAISSNVLRLVSLFGFHQYW